MSNSFTFLASPLAASALVFRKHGFDAPTDAELAASLSITPQELATQYPTREALALHCLLEDMKRQQADHVRLYNQYPSPVERLYGLINYSIQVWPTRLRAITPT